MTSEQKSSFGDNSDFENSAQKAHDFNLALSNRKPTEGEIDQFIELLKNSNSSNQNCNNNEFNVKQCYQYSDSDFRTSISINSSHSNNLLRSHCDSSNSRVTFNTDGTLMKTINVQSTKNLQKSEIEKDVRHNNSYKPCPSDDFRNALYLDQSRIKVTIAREEEDPHEYCSNMDTRRMSNRGDIDRRLLRHEEMFSNKISENENYSRNFGHGSEGQERFSEEFQSSSSYSSQSNKLYIDTDLRVGSSLSPAKSKQLYSHSENTRSQRERSPQFYSESSRHKDNSSYKSCQYFQGRRSQWSRSPSPSKRRRLNSQGKELYSPHEEDSFSDYDMRIHSPEIKEHFVGKRHDKKNSKSSEISQTLSTPPPPVLCDRDLRKSKPKSAQEGTLNKPSDSTFSTLLADKNVSISRLLEAAIGNTGETDSGRNVGWDPAAINGILPRCEQKMIQLYRHRISGPGAFIPDPMPTATPFYDFQSPFVKYYPKLEINSKSVNSIWQYNSSAEPSLTTCQKNKKIVTVTDDDEDEDWLLNPDNSKWKANEKSDEEESIIEEPTIPATETMVSPNTGYQSNAQCIEPSSSWNKDVYSEPPSWTSTYGSNECRNINSELNAYNETIPYQPPQYGSYDTSTWMNSVDFNPLGYPPIQFNNQELVQYPVGHQPVGPQSQFMNNVTPTCYTDVQNNAAQFFGGQPDGLVQYPMTRFPEGPPPPAQWYPSNEQNIQFPETVQYPLKQRMDLNTKTSQSKNTFINPNLISLTGTKCSDTPLPPTTEQNNSDDRISFVSQRDDTKNKLNKRTSNQSNLVVIDKLNKNNSEDSSENKLNTNNSEDSSGNKLNARLEQMHQLIRNIQLNDFKTNDIIKDLEYGPKVYSYAYVMKDEVLHKKDIDYKICVPDSFLSENSILNLFHETFHELSQLELRSFMKKKLTVITKLREKIRNTFYGCSKCRQLKEDAQISKVLEYRRNFRCGRSHSPPNRRKGYYASPPPKRKEISLEMKKESANIPIKSRANSPSTNQLDSKDKIVPLRSRGGNKSISPRRQRRDRSLKRRDRSHSRDRRSRSRGRSTQRRSSSYNRRCSTVKSCRSISRSSPRNKIDCKRRRRSSRSSDVELLTVIETIDLSDDVTDEIENKNTLVNINIKSENQPDSKESTNVNNRSLVRIKFEKPSTIKISSNKEEIDKNGNSDTNKLIKKENKPLKEPIKLNKQPNQKNNDKEKNELGENIVSKPIIDKEEIKLESENVENDQGKLEEVRVVQVSIRAEDAGKNVRVAEEIEKKSKHIDDSQKQNDEAPQPTSSSSPSTTTRSKNIDDSHKQNDEAPQPTSSSSPSTTTSTPTKLDFKTRVRNLQLENNELKQIINCLEGNKEDGLDPSYVMKAGMLCKKCQIGVNNEVRIVAVEEELSGFVFAVHTMSSSHATYEKTLMLFNKHFIPMPDIIDKIARDVISNCQICKQ